MYTAHKESTRLLQHTFVISLLFILEDKSVWAPKSSFLTEYHWSCLQRDYAVFVFIYYCGACVRGELLPQPRKQSLGECFLVALMMCV